MTTPKRAQDAHPGSPSPGPSPVGLGAFASAAAPSEPSRASPLPAQTPAQRLAHFYETLTPATLSALDQFYAPEARFKDPFNEVAGTGAIRRIFEHMFATTDRPRFVVTVRIEQGAEAMLGWEFHFGLRGRSLAVHGVTHLRFSADGRVSLHRDYWDAAEELYEKVPVLGGLMRALKRRLRAAR